MKVDPDSLLCRLAGQTVAAHWLPTGERMNGRTLNDLLCFAWTLPDAGLPFQSRTRDDRTALEALRRRGLVDVQGQTSGVHVRLTPSGCACFWLLDKAAETVRAVASTPTVTPPGGRAVVLGCELCPSAGPWWTAARASDAGWGRYLDELAAAVVALMPLLVLGWTRQFVSVDQQLWAVQLTDDARKAADADHPDGAAGFVFDDAAFASGRSEGVERFSRNPPDSGNVVARMLPASRWA
jgi:hypothetical protein